MAPNWRSLTHSIVSVGGVVVVVLFFREIGRFNSATVALGLLLFVLFVATTWGLQVSVLTSVAAALCFNYFFLPPIGTWTIADPENWVSLVAFLITSIVASQLSARARKRAAEAEEHQRETERLYSLSRIILLTSGTTNEVADEITRNISSVFEIPLVCLYLKSSGTLFGGEKTPDLPISETRNVSETGCRVELENGTIVPLSLGGKPIGSIGLFGVGLADAPLQAIANLASIALERAQSQELASRAELVRRQEEFKSSLLDALAHEFKTPLTAIAAAASAIACAPPQLSENYQDLIAVVVEEAARLNLLVTETMKMAQIEAGKTRLSRERVRLQPVIDRVLERLSAVSGGRSLSVRLREGLEVEADAELIELVLKQYLENAFKHSPPAAPVELTVVEDASQVTVCVADSGNGIDELDQPYVFDKYYRGAHSSKSATGAGIGLSIARDIVMAHGGKTWLESVKGQGSRFYFMIPKAQRKEDPL